MSNFDLRPEDFINDSPSAEKIATLDVRDVRVLAAASFGIACMSAGTLDWERSYQRFDESFIHLGQARKEVVDCFVMPLMDGYRLSDHSKDVLAKSVMVGAGTVAATLGQLPVVTKEIRKLSYDSIANHINSAYQLTERSFITEYNDAVGQIQEEFPAFGSIFTFLKDKAVERNALNGVIGDSASSQRARYLNGFKRAGAMMALASAGALGLTESVKSGGSDLSKIMKFEIPQPLTPYNLCIRPINIRDKNAEAYFIGNPSALYVYKELRDMFYEVHKDQSNAVYGAFIQTCFGSLNSLCSNRQVNQGLAALDIESINDVIGHAYVRAREITMFTSEEELKNIDLQELNYKPTASDKRAQKVINSVNNVPFFKQILDKVELSIAENVDEILGEHVDYEETAIDRIIATRHAALAVALTIYWATELQSVRKSPLAKIA